MVDSENDDAWEWFFPKLQTFVYDVPGLVFISDRHASIYSGLRNVPPVLYYLNSTVNSLTLAGSFYSYSMVIIGVLCF